MVKNLSAMQKTWVWSLCQEDPLEKGMDNPLQYHKESNTTEQLTLTHLLTIRRRLADYIMSGLVLLIWADAR